VINMDDERAGQPKAKRLATTYIDAVQDVAINSPIESKQRNGFTEFSRRIWVKTAGGSYLLILTSDNAEALRFNEKESAA
jgi:hypothetical protein